MTPISSIGGRSMRVFFLRKFHAARLFNYLDSNLVGYG